MSNLKSNKIFSENSSIWNFELVSNFWVGGWLKVSNSSHGYHGILKQWWDFYVNNEKKNVLLISENNIVKNEFNTIYPNWDISTLDLYTEIQQDTCDICANICDEKLPEKYDLIINQATLEHLYDPFGAMKNMCNSLNKDGYLISHSHAKNMDYHQYPRDYMRFMIDWWYDLPNNIPSIKLVELYEDEKLIHVFSCYKKS